MFVEGDLYEGLEELREIEPEYVEEKVERAKELEESVAEQEKRYYEKWDEYVEKSDEASELSKPFTHDGFEGQEGLQSELDHIREVGEEMNDEASKIGSEVSDKLFEKDIEEIREVSPHWAESFVKTKEKILFHPEKLSPDYRFDFMVPFQEINLPLEDGKMSNSLLWKDGNSKTVRGRRKP